MSGHYLLTYRAVNFSFLQMFPLYLVGLNQPVLTSSEGFGLQATFNSIACGAISGLYYYSRDSHSIMGNTLNIPFLFGRRMRIQTWNDATCTSHFYTPAHEASLPT